MLKAPEVLGSVQRIRAVLTIVGALHCDADACIDPAQRLEGVMMTLEGIDEDLKEVEMALIQYA